MDTYECPGLAPLGMYLRVPSQTTTPNFPNSLGKSGLKLSVVDEGSFVPWLGKGDRYKLPPVKRNNTWNGYETPSWLYIDVKSSFISA